MNFIKLKSTKKMELLLKIESSPVKNLKNITNDELERLLILAKDLYYNDSPVISDATFDLMEETLRKRYPQSSYFDNIGAPVREDVVKVKLPSNMGSLDKIKPHTKELERWFSKYPSPYFVSEKLDGISALVTRDHIYTRGDGTYGQDISYLRPYLNLPEMDDGICVRGEFIVRNSVFFKKYSKDYPLPRTLVNSVINSKTPDAKVIKDVRFLGYEIVKKKGDVWSDQFRWMKENGFETSRGEIFEELDSDILTEMYRKWKSESDIEIDGLVISYNNTYTRNKDGNPKYSVAFKVNSDGIETEVLSIEWNPSKFGVLFPTVLVRPVRFEGVVVKRASGKNAKFIEENGIGPKSKIKVVYSGGVIPEITDIISKKPPGFPKDMKYHWNETHVNIILNNPLKNEEVRIKRLLHMFEILETKGVSIGIITKFYENGLDTLEKIWRLEEKDFLNLPGIQEKTAKKLHDSIHSAIDKPLSLEKIMTLSLVFDNGFAEKKFKLIVDEIPDILKIYRSVTTERISDIEGFSDKTADVFVEKLPLFIDFMKKHSFLKVKETTSRKSGGKISLNVVFSGFRDTVLKGSIEEAGGKVSDTVSSKTSVLIVKEKEDNPTGKVKKALKLGIKILTRDEFSREYHL